MWDEEIAQVTIGHSLSEFYLYYLLTKRQCLLCKLYLGILFQFVHRQENLKPITFWGKTCREVDTTESKTRTSTTVCMQLGKKQIEFTSVPLLPNVVKENHPMVLAISNPP